MSIFERLFRQTLPPEPLRDEGGRFVSAHKISVREKAIAMAQFKGRDDLVARLGGAA